MKQLLQTLGNQHAVMGLHHVALAVIAASVAESNDNEVSHHNHPNHSHSHDEHHNSNSYNNPYNYHVIELVNPMTSSAANTAATSTATAGAAEPLEQHQQQQQLQPCAAVSSTAVDAHAQVIGEEVADEEDAVNANITSLELSPNKIEDVPEVIPDQTPDPHDIQAVALTQTHHDGCVWYAVARYDKTLALYCYNQNQQPHSELAAETLPHSATETSTTDATTSTPHHQQQHQIANNDPAALKAPPPLYPVTVHKTVKRVSALSFARVPQASSTTNEQTLETPLTVIIAADLAGDAYAFPLQLPPTPTTASTTTTTSTTIPSDDDVVDSSNNQTSDEKDDDGDNNDNNNSNLHRGRQRLLVGHTASMLTAMAMAEDDSKLITADRDEKLRISSFPNTHLIQGYLLGHTAFVSCFDVISGGATSQQPQVLYAVSGSGDGTIRLWDVHRFQELASCDTTQERKTLQGGSSSSLIPTGIRWLGGGNGYQTTKGTSNSNYFAVIFDNSVYLDLFQVVVTHDTTTTTSQPSKASTTNGSSHNTATSDDSNNLQQPAACKYSLSRVDRVECDAQPLALSLWGEDQLFVITGAPIYAQLYKIRRSDHHHGSSKKAAIMMLSSVKNCVLTRSLRMYANAHSIYMPLSILERDKFGQLKMAKLNETRGPSATAAAAAAGQASTLVEAPWNKSHRIEQARERNKRSKKRKREREKNIEND